MDAALCSDIESALRRSMTGEERVPVPLSSVFLLLRVCDYNPEALLDYRQVVSKKLRVLWTAGGTGAVRAHAADLERCLKTPMFAAQPQRFMWICELLRDISIRREEAQPPRNRHRTVVPTVADSGFGNGYKRRCAAPNDAINGVRSAASTPATSSSAPEGRPRKRRRSTTAAAQSVALSECSIWRQQKAFYCKLGVKAWTSGAVPYSISSSPYVATLYARTIIEWWTQASKIAGGTLGVVHVLELGAGHCKLGFHIAQTLKRSSSVVSNGSPLPKFCIVMCDLSREVCENRMALPCFSELLWDGIVDFACVDVEDGLRAIELLHSGQRLRRAEVKHPIVILGNYVLDSLPIDIYRHCEHGLQRLSASVSAMPEEQVSWQKWMAVTRFCWTKASMEILASSCASGGVQSKVLREVFSKRLSQDSEAAGGASGVGEDEPFTVPVGAARLVRDICALRHPEAKSPLLCIFGDKTFGSKEPAAVSVEDSGPPAILVHHSAGNNDGCVSASVDLDLISRLIREACGQPAHDACCYSVPDRVSSTGGLFDVVATTSCCDLRCMLEGRSHALSVTDVEAIIKVAFSSASESWTAEELVSLIELSEFDIACFVKVCWPLSRKLTEMRVAAKSSQSMSLTTHHRAVRAALRCHESRFDVCSSSATHHSRALLVARWLYTIRCDSSCIARLLDGHRSRKESVHILAKMQTQAYRCEEVHLCKKQKKDI